jgi:hypothetical protein
VGTNDFIGLGNSSSSARRNTIIVPFNCKLEQFAFSIRELGNAVPYTATLYVNGAITSVQAIIPDGSVNYSITTPISFNLSTLDLITIQITFQNGALSNGACITLVATK